jgi:hypothetical protein
MMQENNIKKVSTENKLDKLKVLLNSWKHTYKSSNWKEKKELGSKAGSWLQSGSKVWLKVSVV